jgi:hypothetical protein
MRAVRALTPTSSYRKKDRQNPANVEIRIVVERLAEGTTGPSRIRVGTHEFTARMSPTKAKFFGVLPADAQASTIEAQLKESGHSHEILGVDIKAGPVKDIAASLQPLAEVLAKAAP